MIELTKAYIHYFENKMLMEILSLLEDDFYLEDPVVKHVTGSVSVEKFFKDFFSSNETISFKANNIYIDNERNVSIIEFELNLDGMILFGTDIIEWSENNKMKCLRAYLDIPK
ncbi:hypothetical protein [Halobacteriovorax sp. DPLXC-1]|uniref:hypothetical protein n=1 Tax=Halobacteriovorax sp. DPLXC-1 TaxID=3110771 RepID=UPI002FEF382F